jgi:hypothetical protein
MAITNSDYLQSLGKNSKTTFLAIENTKLSIEALASVAIKRGQAVKLAVDGTVLPWLKTDIRDLCIGYAYNDGAIGDLVTIFTRGFCIVLGISTGALSAGVVCPQTYDVATVVNGSTGYIPFAAAGGGEFNNGWSLDQTAGANALIRVLMMD